MQPSALVLKMSVSMRGLFQRQVVGGEADDGLLLARELARHSCPLVISRSGRCRRPT